MNTFNPEARESKEKYYEFSKFSENMEKKLLEVLKANREVFPDLVTCPKQSCRTPVTVNIKKEFIELLCPKCGWSKIIQQPISNSRE